MDQFFTNTELADLFLAVYAVGLFGDRVMKQPSGSSDLFKASWENLGKRSAQSIVEVLDILTSVEQPVDKSKATEFTKAMGDLKSLKGEVEYLRVSHPKSLFNDKNKFMILFGSVFTLIVLLNVLALLLIGK